MIVGLGYPFLRVDVVGSILDKILCWLENLALIVVGGSKDYPWPRWQPGEVTDTIGEASVHEQPIKVNVLDKATDGRREREVK